MSNLIKANYIHYSQEEKKVIHSDGRTGEFQNLSLARVEELEHEEPFYDEAAEEASGQELPDEEESLLEQKQLLLREAMEEAEAVKREAETEAVNIKREAEEAGRQEGYEAGIREAQAELSRRQDELNEQERLLNRQYDEAVSSLEPAFVSLLIDYLERMTGILCEGKKEVILHLVSRAMHNLERSRRFLIRVSSADFPAVEQARENLRGAAGEGATVEIMEDPAMEKNQCLIETDDRIIDCSLKEQLKGLEEDLKLLARI